MMTRFLFSFLVLISALSNAQNVKFGEGIKYYNQDSSFYLRSAFRIQSLYEFNWDVRNDDFGYVENLSSDFVIRRSRLKFDGYAFNKDITYKMELGIASGDLSGGNSVEHGWAPRLILDAYVDWKFYKNFSIRFGQSKLPGNRERVISSACMQFVDRSRLNSRFNIDRDMGIQLMHNFKLGDNFLVQEIFAFSQGEGRDITAGNFGGYDYTFRLEVLPFGKFKHKGDYIGSAIDREEKPKLAIGATYDINDKAVRTNGQLGNFIINSNGEYVGKSLNTIFVDFMFKFKGLSVMGEYANRKTSDNDPIVYDIDGTTSLARFYTGSAYNIQAGWMFKNNYEIAGRYTYVQPQLTTVVRETEYTLGLSKYISGHNLKVQTDLSYRVLDFDGNTSAGNGRNDLFMWRVQVDFHL